jgi:hypothetical protein
MVIKLSSRAQEDLEHFQNQRLVIPIPLQAIRLSIINVNTHYVWGNSAYFVTCLVMCKEYLIQQKNYSIVETSAYATPDSEYGMLVSFDI